MKEIKEILNNERGVVLVISLMILTLLVGAGVGAIVSTQTDLKTSGNIKTRAEAFYIANAGINHAWQELADGDGTNDFTSVFDSGTTAVPPFSNTNFGSGSYAVTVQAVSGSSPKRIKVTSTGCLPEVTGTGNCPTGNSKAIIETQFNEEEGKPDKAIQTDGDLKINGNPDIMGTRGGAHSNEDMEISGNPGIQLADGLTASNKTTNDGGTSDGMDISGNPCVGSADCDKPAGQQPDENKLDTNEKKDDYEAAHNSASEETIPTINPADYAQKVADLGGSEPAYILHDDGTVTTGGTCVTDGLCTGGTPVTMIPSGWSFSGDTWKVSGHSAADGIFYSEGKIEISGSVGSDEDPLQATLIARDDIKISGNPDIKPYPTTSDDLKNHLLVTGNDLEISGNMEADYAVGAILVHQQFKISGNPKIKGFIIAGDGQPTWAGDPFTNSSSGVTRNEISGNATITYDGNVGCSGPGCPLPTVKLVTWREVF